MLFLALLLQAAAAPSPPAPPERPKPIFTYEDYPPEAVRKHWQGTAVVQLTIDTEGQPKACRVVKSSGYKVLHDKTCEMIMTRAKFVPSPDKDGKPRWDTFQAPPITWQIR